MKFEGAESELSLLLAKKHTTHGHKFADVYLKSLSN